MSLKNWRVYIKKNLVFVIGAGSTYNEGIEWKIEESKLPPLDKKFFCKYKQEPNEYANSIIKYLNDTYGIDIYKDEYNSLEKIMVILYLDIFRSQPSFKLFQNLLMLLNNRLAESTNNLNSNPENSFYNILKFYISNFNLKPDQLTFITFNYDIQIEKLIDKMGRDENVKTDLLNFPYCYQLLKFTESKKEEIKMKDGMEFFDKGSKEKKRVKILKLHGSINWHGIFSKLPIGTMETLYDKDRDMIIYFDKTLYTTKEELSPNRHRKFHSFPIIVPPVIHKSELFHENIDHIWNQAEEKLKDASEIIIFGYSFPASDLESFYLFKRALKDRNDINISIIDPDPSVFQKFFNIYDRNKINFYKSPSDFLKHIKLLNG